MKTACFKFLSLAAIASMTLCASCSDDDDEVNIPEPQPSAPSAYSSELFLNKDNHNAVNYDFDGLFSKKYVGVVNGGENMPQVDDFFEAAPYSGAVTEKGDWTEGWIRLDGTGNETSSGAVEVLKGTLSSAKTLKSGMTYALDGEYIVKAGGELTIEPGVKIVAITADESVDYILIEQGAKIFAEGTREKPIVMTSDRKEAGAWGGLHICGRAHTNVEGGKGVSEIGNAAYGGDDDTDNSGVLKYVRMENTGYALDSEHEANGITFYGVGSGTQVEYVEAYNGSDDGFEFFGGSVNIKHMVVVDCTDDSFDWTEGWKGKAQFLVAYQQNPECDCLMECDNNGKNFDATPVACPTIANATLVGNNGSRQGIRLRAGTQVRLYNTLVTGKAKCLTTETLQTEKALVDGSSKLKYVILATDIECNGTK